MKLVYAIINFLILAVALYFIGRKMVVRKFRERKERIAQELERAQQAHEDAERAAAEIAAAQADAAAQSEALLDGARRQAQSGSEAAATHRQAEADMVLYNAGQSEQYLREEMYDGVRAGAIRKAAELTRGVVAQPEFAHARQTLTEQFLQQVGDLLTATPSDELKIQSAQALGITVTTADGSQSAACTVNVATPLPEPPKEKLGLRSIYQDKGETINEFSAKVGSTVQMRVDGTEQTVTWTIEDAKIATVDANGLVTAVAKGKTILKATVGDQSVSCFVIVN